MRALFVSLFCLVAVWCAPHEAQAQAIVLPCVPSGTSCIPVSAANPLPTTGGAVISGTTPCTGCASGGVLFNNGGVVTATSAFTSNGSVVQILTDGSSLLIGSGTNTTVSIGFASSRALLGYNGSAAYIQGGVGKGVDITPDGGSSKLTISPSGLTGGQSILSVPTNGVIEQINSTNPQEFHYYNTFTSSTNYERAIFGWQVNTNVLTIGTQVGSSGTARNIQFVAGGLTGATLTPLQSVVLNSAAVATNATDGFLYLASGAGTPTGTPTTFTGRVPMYVDTTNSQLWLYLGGAWKQPKTPAAAAIITWQ